MDITTIIGLVAAVLSTASFAPQVIKTWKSKSARDFSLGMLTLFAAGAALWLTYGILNRDIPVILANALVLAQVLIILYVKLTSNE